MEKKEQLFKNKTNKIKHSNKFNISRQMNYGKANDLKYFEPFKHPNIYLDA